MPVPVVKFACGISGHIFDTYEDAKTCESMTKTKPQYKTGDEIKFKSVIFTEAKEGETVEPKYVDLEGIVLFSGYQANLQKMEHEPYYIVSSGDDEYRVATYNTRIKPEDDAVEMLFSPPEHKLEKGAAAQIMTQMRSVT